MKLGNITQLFYIFQRMELINKHLMLRKRYLITKFSFLISFFSINMDPIIRRGAFFNLILTEAIVYINLCRDVKSLIFSIFFKLFKTSHLYMDAYTPNYEERINLYETEEGRKSLIQIINLNS